MNQKGFINIILVIIVVLLVGAGVYFVSTRPIIAPAPNPTPTSNGEKITKKIGEQESSFLIQKINSSSVLGLWYQKYPVARSEGTPRTLYIGNDIGYACEGVSEKLSSIDYTLQTVTFTKVVSQPPHGGCPI